MGDSVNQKSAGFAGIERLSLLFLDCFLLQEARRVFSDHRFCFLAIHRDIVTAIGVFGELGMFAGKVTEFFFFGHNALAVTESYW